MRLILLLIAVAHAGWWSDFCERHLIADDPYQWEVYDKYWLIKEQDRIKIRMEWPQI